MVTNPISPLRFPANNIGDTCSFYPSDNVMLFLPNCAYGPGNNPSPDADVTYETFSCNSQDSAPVDQITSALSPLATEDSLDTASDVVDAALGVSVINMILLLVVTSVVVFRCQRCRPGGAMSSSSA